MENLPVKKKKALAEITHPYKFIQLVWVVLSYPEHEWDVLIRYADGQSEIVRELADLCRKTGLFHDVREMNRSGLGASSFSKMKEMAKVLFYVFTFRREKYCRKLIAQEFGDTKYQLFCAETSFSFFGCAMMNQSRKIPTILLEDGSWEYADVRTYFGMADRIAGTILFRLKVVNFITKKNFYWNRYCLKYATRPELLIEKDFRKVRRLFSNKELMVRFNAVMKDIYRLEELDYDVVAFTSVSLSPGKYSDNQLFKEWMEKRYAGKRILYKNHPMDSSDYSGGSENADCKYKMVPGELLIRLIGGAEVVFMFPSTMMLSFPKDRKIKAVHFNPKIMIPEYQQGFEETLRMCKRCEIQTVEIPS